MKILKIRIFDLGHGNSIHIETPNGKNILFDLGGYNVVNFLYQNNKEIDYLIISHPHKDHIEGLKYLGDMSIKINSITRNRKIPNNLLNKLVLDAFDEDKEMYKKYIKLNEDYIHSVPRNESMINPNNTNGVEIKLFSPSKSDVSDLNYYSLSTLINFHGVKFLLMGDNTLENIDEIKKSDFYREIENVYLLFAPHHGRNSSYDSEFLSHINPMITIISDFTDDNSAIDKYSKKSRGFLVGDVKRYCLTTRNDGNILIECHQEDNINYANVKTNEKFI